MIFKIQKPLLTNEEVPMALISSRNKRVRALVAWSLVEELFEPDELKVYVKGNIDRKNRLLVDEIIEPQRF